MNRNLRKVSTGVMLLGLLLVDLRRMQLMQEVKPP